MESNDAELSDDQTLLDEIEAIDIALSEKTPNLQVASTSQCAVEAPVFLKVENDQDLQNETIHSFNQISSDNVLNGELVTFEPCGDVDQLEELLQINRKLIDSLLMARKELTAILEDCLKKLAITDEKLSKQMQPWQDTKVVTCTAGIPYFKDKEHYAAPKNDDAKTKATNGELQLVHLRCVCRWSTTDRCILFKAIRQETILSMLDESQNEFDTQNVLSKGSQLQKSIKHAIGSLGSKEFDWLKIAAMDFDNKHSADECRIMWNLFLHPDINKYRWNKEEEAKLNKMVKKFKYRDWDMIAKALGTNRTGYQCFIRYNTNNWKNLMKGRFWMSGEDAALTNLVNTLKIGDHIPWGYIASCLKNRTKQQVYYRWTFSLAPHLKKGRFTKEEDEILLKAISMYGKKFGTISAVVMPNRTAVQLGDHYNTLLQRQRNNQNIWTTEDDHKLVKLYSKHGPNWAQIVKDMPHKTRIQARHRYMAILRYQSKGITIESMSRNRTDPPKVIMNPAVSPELRITGNEEHTDIDQKLTSYFKNYHAHNDTFDISKHKDDSRKLYRLLKNMGCHDFKIPNYNYYLHFFDAQLLKSIEKYHSNSPRAFKQSTMLHNLRVKMFGSQANIKNSHFEPPLPFGCRPAPKRRYKGHGLNYVYDPSERYQMELPSTYEFDTPSSVVQVIGKENEEQFTKLLKVLHGQTRKKPIIYVLTPHQIKESVAVTNCNDKGTKTKYNWLRDRLVIEHMTREESIEEEVYVPTLNPSYTTLFTYRGILSATENIPYDINRPFVENKLTERGRYALSLLRRRYEYLFRLPIGMSRIVPPDPSQLNNPIILPNYKPLKNQMKRAADKSAAKQIKKVKAY